MKVKKKVLKITKKSIGDYYREGNTSPLEYDILSRYRHPYLLKLDKIYTNIRYNGVALLLPYYPTNYGNYIEDKNPTTITKLSICYKIMEVSDFLFKNGILHLDIKPDNILIDEKDNPILADFDIAIKVDSTKSMISLARDVIALQIRPYELLVKNSNLIGEHTLVHQLGYLIYMSFSNRLFYPQNRQKMKKYIEDNFNENNIKDTINKTIECEISLRANLVDLLCNTITPIAAKRFTMKELFSHPIWNIIHKEEVKGCVIEPVVTNYIRCDNSINRIYNHLISYYAKYFTGYNLPVDILFASIDLLYRTVHLVSNSENKNIISLEIAIIFICWKLYSGYVDPNKLCIDDFILTNPYSLLSNISNVDVLNWENKIILNLEGQLCRTYIYNSISKHELSHAINTILFDFDKYISFVAERLDETNRPGLCQTLLYKKITI
jgi:serine/threonine protein kinase